MKNLFKELKGKNIRIKSWDEMHNIENALICKDEIQIISFLENEYITTSFNNEMRHLCNKIIHVDENMMPDHLFIKAKKSLIKDRELLYYDKETDEYYNLDLCMFDVLD